MSTCSVVILSVSALTLAACAGKTPPPAIAYDSDSFHQAVVVPDPPKPVEIVQSPRRFRCRVSFNHRHRR